MDNEETELRGLAAGAQQGDPDAWEAIYRRAYPRLFAFVRRRLATEDQAEDAVSETMTRAMRGIDGFTWVGAGIDGWLFGIARNVVLETYRESSRTLPQDSAAWAEAAESGSDPVDQMLGDEETRDLRRAFGRLAPADRELLELRVVAGLDSGQVGEMLGRLPGAVRTAQSRALGRLRTEFEGLRA